MSQSANIPNRREVEAAVFLDFDGVLNQAGTVGDPGGPGFSRECLEHLNTILDATGASIVISSEWRREFTGTQLNEFLWAGGLKREYRVLDWTPVLDTRSAGGIAIAKTRWDEIKHWLARFRNVTRFVILDDACTGFPPPEHMVCCRDGLTAEDAQRAITILLNEPWELEAGA